MPAPTPEDKVIERIIDPESSAYDSNMAFWIGQLREWKHQSRSADPGKIDYGIYHCCRGIFEQSRQLLTNTSASNVIAVGNAVIQEFERALPFASEGSSARENIGHLIQNVRTGVEKLKA